MSDEHSPENTREPAAGAAGQAAPGTGDSPGGFRVSSTLREHEAPDARAMNPYLAGVFLGITLLASYLILGVGLTAFGGFARLGAWLEHAVLPARVEALPLAGSWFPAPLSSYLTYMALGVFAGGLLSALTGGRMRFTVERGPGVRPARRLVLALAGGVLAGFAPGLSRGDALGLGLGGGALLSSGGFVFLGCFLAAGFLAAWASGRQWK